MAPEKTPVCITCGQGVCDPPVLHRLPSGRPCSSCADRLLESLPAVLPGMRTGEPAGRGRLFLLGDPTLEAPALAPEDSPA